MLSIAYSVKMPLAVLKIPAEERDTRIVMTPDQCVIDNREFYVRGRFLIPVQEIEEPFAWSLWAEISPKNFLRTNELWETPGRENEPVFTGYINNELPLYGEMRNLVIDVQTMPVGRLPHFLVRDAEHPLAQQQRNGITLAEVEAIAIKMHHPETVTE